MEFILLCCLSIWLEVHMLGGLTNKSFFLLLNYDIVMAHLFTYYGGLTFQIHYMLSISQMKKICKCGI